MPALTATLALLLAGLFEARPAEPKAEVAALLESRQYAKALALAQDLNHKSMDDVVVYRYLAEAYLGLGRLKEAEEAAQWMLDLRLGKADTPGYLVIARLRIAFGDPEGAREILSTALQRTTPAQPSERAAILALASRIDNRKPHRSPAK